MEKAVQREFSDAVVLFDMKMRSNLITLKLKRPGSFGDLV